MIRQRATWRYEATNDLPWFVYIEDDRGQLILVCRFETAINADVVGSTINDILRAEGRLFFREDPRR